MPELSWSPTLEIGVEAIDKQHQQLVTIANRVIEAVTGNRDEKYVCEIVKELREYTVAHFRCEEAHMEAARFPQFSAHRQEHERLKNQVRQWQRDLYTNKIVTVEEVFGFLRVWLLEHILRMDMEFRNWLAEHPELAPKKGKKG